MVFQAKNHVNELTRYEDGGTHSRPVARALHMVALWSLMVVATSALAQEQDPDFVDAFAPVDASASAFHSEKFHEAERALLEGLSRKDAVSGQRNREHPTLRNVSATSKAQLKQAVTGDSEPSALPPQPTILEHTSLSEPKSKLAPQELKAPMEQTQRAEPSVSTKKLEATAQVLEPKEERRAQAAQVAKAAPKITKPAPSDVRPQINEQDAEIRNLQRELADAKSALAAAELEISRLSAIIQDASRARLSIGGSSPSLAKGAQKTLTQAPVAKHVPVTAPSLQPPPPASPSEPSGDIQVATISVEKADLRLGPGRNHSPLMSLRRGSRLAVEARQGEWYRVFAPNGQRAWIHSSLVRFGNGAASLNDGSAVKVRGYDNNLQ
jgi:hypothetical protein